MVEQIFFSSQVVGISNELFIRCSSTETNFQKDIVVNDSSQVKQNLIISNELVYKSCSTSCRTT